jgi:hypothetical protein
LGTTLELALSLAPKDWTLDTICMCAVKKQSPV